MKATLLLLSTAALVTAGCNLGPHMESGVRYNNPTTPPAEAPRELTLEEAKALEAPSLPLYKVELLGRSISVEAAGAPEVKIEVDDNGAQAATVLIPLAEGRPRAICFANEHMRTFGATMRAFFSGILKDHPMRPSAQEFAIEGDSVHPLVRFDAVFTTPQKAAIPLQVVFAPMSTRSGMCVIEGMAFHKTLLRIAKEVLTPLADLEPPSVYSELKVIRMEGLPIGFEWDRYFDRGAKQLGYQSITGTFGLSREGLMFHDSFHEARIDDRGQLTRAETQSVDNRGKTASVLERTQKGAVYTRLVGGREHKADIAQMPTSNLEDARIYSKVAHGDKKTAVPTFPNRDGKIIPIMISREGERTLLLKYNDEVSRCELDENGSCTKKTSGSLVHERVSSQGTFPKLH